MSQSSDIKNKIKAKLDDLVNEQILGCAVMDDFKTDPLSRDFSKFPAAILMTPSITGDYETNTQNVRTYTYGIVVLCKGEDVTDFVAIEELQENIFNKFDNVPSLQGAADAGLDPSSSPAEAVVSQGGKSFVIFTVSLKAKVVKDLTFEL